MYKYDNYGNKISQTVEAIGETKRVTTFEYDKEHKNIVLVTNPLGFTIHTIYNITNQPIKITDTNNLSLTPLYDKMGKKIKEIRPDGTITTWEYSWDSSIPNSLYKVTQTSTGVPPVTIYYDKFNKEVRSEKVGFDGLKIYEDKIYNKKGQLEKSTTPYYSGDKVYLYSYYDDLNRLVETKRFDKDDNEVKTVYEYDGLNITVTNPKGHKKTTINNIIGKKIKVIEEDSFITYKYDAFGNLIQTTDSKNNNIILNYDIFGNKIYQNDPDMGIWHYSYNAFGQLISQTDAKGQTSTTKYDILGRVVEKNEAGEISVFKYDMTPSTKGKLFSSSIPVQKYVKEYYYDEYGRVEKNIEYIDNKIFTTRYTYNEEGKLEDTIHPNGFILRSEYNTQGYLSALKSPKDVDENFTTLKLKELIKETLDKKTEAFNKLIQLNGQIETYRVKAIQLLNIAKDYKSINEPIYTQLNKTASYLIETSISLRDIAKKHEANYQNYKQEQDFYLSKLLQHNDEYIYKWLMDTFSSYTTTLISQALEQLKNATDILNTINTTELLQTYKEIVNYHIQESKTIIYEAKTNLELYNNYKEKYKNLGDETYKGIFDNSEFKYYYKILKTDVFGRITKSFSGNGLITTKDYDNTNGQLTSIQTGYNGSNDIRYIQYEYDVLNNVTKKQDNKQDITQTFTYDSLDRIKQATTTSPNTNTIINYEYDNVGNIVYKSDVGTYTYTKAHQVSKAGSNTYIYDENGNAIKKNNITIKYNAYNKPILLQDDKNKTEFFYNADRQRYKKVLNNHSTYYIGKLYERENTPTHILEKNYIYAGEKLVAIHTTQDDGRLKLPQNRYLHKDSLGSIDTITNESGVVLQRLSYNPFGKQIIQSWINDNQANKPLVKRGYTGHEHIKEFDLIHMNGRVYDPNTGRFISADPNIFHPFDTQDFNRYSYVRNNPFKYTDPSGFGINGSNIGGGGGGWGWGSIGDAFGAIGDAIGDAFGAIGDALGSIGDAIGDALGSIGDAIGDIGGSIKESFSDPTNKGNARQRYLNEVARISPIAARYALNKMMKDAKPTEDSIKSEYGEVNDLNTMMALDKYNQEFPEHIRDMYNKGFTLAAYEPNAVGVGELTTNNKGNFENTSFYGGYGFGFNLGLKLKSYPFGIKIQAVAMPGFKMNNNNKFEKSKKVEMSFSLSVGVYQVNVKYTKQKGLEYNDKYSINGVSADEKKKSISFNVGGGAILHGEANLQYNYE